MKTKMNKEQLRLGIFLCQISNYKFNRAKVIHKGTGLKLNAKIHLSYKGNKELTLFKTFRKI